MVRLEHSRTTLSEGWETSFGILMTVLIFAVLQLLFFPEMWTHRPWGIVGIVAIVLFEVLWCGGMISVVVVDIRCRGTFRCVLDDEKIECFCPVRFKGESFVLRLDKIARVEKRYSNDSHSWYLHDHDGDCYWLTAHYGNPDGEFVREILKLRPGISQIET